MNNAAAKTHAPGQWLLNSMYWALGCVGGWLVWLSISVQLGWHLRSTAADIATIATYWLAHVLIWRRALAGGDAFLRTPEAQGYGLGVVGSLWIALLVVFQIIAFIVGVVGTLFIPLFSCSKCLD